MATVSMEQLSSYLGTSNENSNHSWNEVISVVTNCQSKDVQKLCICDLPYRVKHNSHFDLGGTYTGTESDLWFYMTTSTFSEKGHLVNLFVNHRKVGDVIITIKYDGVTNTRILKSNKPNQNYHLKTICLTTDHISLIKDNTIYIPISIDMDPTQLVNPEVIKKLKIQNILGEKLLKQKQTDFTLESASRKQYPVHKVVLCAHSPVLRELVKNASKTSEFLDISDDDMELLVEFLYTGTVKDLQEKDCMRLQEIACKFELANLFLLAQHLICDKINIENAVHIAALANKYNLGGLWEKVIKFIRQNPSVMGTESWKNLNDMNLAKELCAALVK